MKRNNIPVILMLITVILFYGCHNDPLEEPQDSLSFGDFTYTKTEEAVTLTGYTGESANITIPADIESLPVTAFDKSFFSNLTFIESFTMESTTPPNLSEDALINCSSLKTIFVPDGYHDIYTSDESWKNYKKYIVIREGTITFDPNYVTATGSMEPLKIKGGVSKELTPCGFSVSGYSFSGWTSSAEAKAVEYANKASYTMISGSITLYALWSKAETIPKAPGYVSADLTSSEEADVAVKIKWTDNSDNESDFVIFRQIEGGDLLELASTKADETSYIDTTVEREKTYIYSILAKNSMGESKRIEAAKLLVPVKGVANPGSVSVSLVKSKKDTGSVKISWKDASDNETAFVILRQAEGGNISETGSTKADTTSYIDTTVERGITYTYRVVAKNSQVQSSSVSSSSVTIPFLIKFDLEGGNIGGTAINPESQEILNGEFVDLPDTNPVKEGSYGFDGWYTSTDENGSQVTESTPITGNLTLHAYWIHYLKYKLDSNDNAIITGYESSYLPEDLTIPKTIDGYSVVSIDNGSFQNCTIFKSLVLSDSLLSIGEGAFWGCSALKEIDWGNKITEITYRAFSDCKELVSLVLPDSVETLGDRAFFTCSKLESVTIGKNIDTIAEGVFRHCVSLSSVTFTGTTPPILKPAASNQIDIFLENAPNRKIYVPGSVIDDYKGAAMWSQFANDILAIP